MVWLMELNNLSGKIYLECHYNETMGMEIKKLDKHGRIVIPKDWRKKHGDEVIILVLEDRVEILPRKGNIMRFVNSIEVDELKEWEEMREELYEVR